MGPGSDRLGGAVPRPSVAPVVRGSVHRVAAVAAALAAEASTDELLGLVVRHAVDGVRADGGAAALVRGTSMQVPLVVGSLPELEADVPVPLSTDSPAADAARSGRVVEVPALADLQARYPKVAQVDGASVASVSVPIRIGPIVLGVLLVGFGEPRQLDQDELALLEALTDLLGIGLDRLDLQSRAARTDALAAANVVGVIAGVGETITDANDEFLRTVGYDRQDLLEGRLRWPELTPPEHLAVDLDTVDDLREGQARPVAKELVRKDGTRVPVMIGASTVGWDPFEWFSVVLDVSESARLRHAAESEAAVISTLLASAPVGFAVFDADLRVARINESLAAMNGFTVDEHLGRAIFELLPELREQAEPLLRDVLETGRAVQEVEIVGTTPADPGRQHCWLESFFPVRTGDGTIIGVAAVALDITERMELERSLAETAALLDTALDRAPAGLAFLDADLRFVRINEAMASMNGRSVEEHLGHRLDEVLPELDEMVGAYLRRVLTTGEPITDVELAGPNIDGRHHEVLAGYYPLPGRDGRTAGVGVVVVDVTERNALQRAIEAAMESRIAIQQDALDQLQRGYLPHRMPAVAGIELDARYLAAADLVRVGGDWYDAFEAPDGRLVVAVGDAVGHGVGAVELMGLARNALRGVVALGQRPAEAVDTLHQMLLADPSSMATLVLAALDPGSGAVEYALAGHPPPLLRRADGSHEVLDEARGVPLGSLPGGTFRAASCALSPGDALVLYTDGLVERRDEGIDDGLARIRSCLAGPARDAAELSGSILRHCLEGSSLEDDVCLLTVRRQP